MGWTKHPGTVTSYRSARSQTYADIKKFSVRIRQELEDPRDIHGAELYSLAYALHSDLRRFVWFRNAVGGHEGVNTRPFVDLLLEVFSQFKWRVHV
jgi:hypothetical protein